MTPDELRASATRLVRWYRDHRAEIGCARGDLDAFAALVEREIERDFSDLEPRPTLLCLIERPDRYEELVETQAPAIVLSDLKRKLASVIGLVLSIPDEPGKSAFFEPRSRGVFSRDGLSFRYRSFWDASSSSELKDGDSLESGWTTLDFSDRYLTALRKPGWEKLRHQQMELIKAHHFEFVGQDLPNNAKIEDLRELLNSQNAPDPFVEGLLETPFFVGRLAFLLGPPVEAWGGGSYSLMGEVDGHSFSAVATEGEGLGIRHLMGVVAYASPHEVRRALERFSSVILESPELGSAETICFHYEKVYRAGVRNGSLFKEAVARAPFWIDAFWRYGA